MSTEYITHEYRVLTHEYKEGMEETSLENEGGGQLQFPFTLKGQDPSQSCLQALFFSLNGKVMVGVLDLFIPFANTDNIPGVPSW